MLKHQTSDIQKLGDLANQIRILALQMIHAAGSGHPGGSLSIAEIMATLYFNEMNFSAQALTDPSRDRLILSKGHAAPALYAVLRILGLLNDEDMANLRKVSGRLEGHVAKGVTPGVEMSTGSLGQGLSVSVGLALSARLDKRDFRVYTILGDGECQEGMVWEAAMAAGHYHVDNLCAFVDVNGLQIDGRVVDIMNVNPIDTKFAAFGWHIINIDGHDINQIQKALETARQTKNKPTAIIAKTVKGKGVSFMEGDYKWHGTAPNDKEMELAIAGLQKK
jgi:transketolase